MNEEQTFMYYDYIENHLQDISRQKDVRIDKIWRTFGTRKEEDRIE